MITIFTINLSIIFINYKLNNYIELSHTQKLILHCAEKVKSCVQFYKSLYPEFKDLILSYFDDLLFIVDSKF